MVYTDVDTIRGLIFFIRHDLSTNNHNIRFKTFFIRYLIEPGFKYIFWLRNTRHYWLCRSNPLSLIMFIICRFIFKHYGYKYGYDFSYRTCIGKGLSISHHGTIVVRSSTRIGDNCSFRPGVIIGQKLTDDLPSIIGNNVDFGVGAKIIGGVKVGNNVIIGANAVVTKDIPDNAVCVGIPAKVIRFR